MGVVWDMILVSCRKDFNSDRIFAPANQVEGMTDSQLADRVRGKHVLILIHGYRTPMKNVRAAYLAIEDGLRAEGLLSPSNYGEVLGFAWPSYRLRISFPAAIPHANTASEYFYDLMRLLTGAARTIDVQTHSLGARVALQGLAAQGEVKSDNLILTAPAVDNECLEPAREFNEVLGRTRRCYVLHSKRDSVLRMYALAKADRALGKNGPQRPKVIEQQCPNVYVVDCHRVVKKDHSGYRKTPLYYDFWKQVLETPSAIRRFSVWE